MNIKSIQSSQSVPAILRSNEKSYAKADAGTGFASDSSTPVSPGLSPSTSTDVSQLPEVQAQVLVNRVDYIKEQLDKILVEFPPFFPLGTYQRLDLIEGIRNLQEDVERSSVASSMKAEISSQKLNENATDQEISAALDKLLYFRDDLVKSTPATTQSLEPGTVVSIRV